MRVKRSQHYLLSRHSTIGSCKTLPVQIASLIMRAELTEGTNWLAAESINVTLTKATSLAHLACQPVREEQTTVSLPTRLPCAVCEAQARHIHMWALHSAVYAVQSTRLRWDHAQNGDLDTRRLDCRAICNVSPICHLFAAGLCRNVPKKTRN